MRISKTISITLPPEMFERAHALARDENRTMSELMREARRQYIADYIIQERRKERKKRAAFSEDAIE